MSFHLVQIQVKNQMLHRHNRTIHHYIQQVQKTSSKQIQRKIDGTFKRQQNKAHQIPIS